MSQRDPPFQSVRNPPFNTPMKQHAHPFFFCKLLFPFFGLTLLVHLELYPPPLAVKCVKLAPDPFTIQLLLRRLPRVCGDVAYYLLRWDPTELVHREAHFLLQFQTAVQKQINVF